MFRLMASRDAPRPGPRKLPKQERSRALFEAILQAARQVIELRGADFTLVEIATRAGVGPGSLYQYFPDRHALVGALIDEQIADDRKSLEMAREMFETSNSDQLPDLIALGIVGLYGKRPRFLTSMVELMREVGRQGDLQEVVSEFSGLVTARLAVLLPERSVEELSQASATAVAAALGGVRQLADTAPEELSKPELRSRIAGVIRASLSLP